MSKATEKAYTVIRESILNGTYAPGAHLKEAELVTRCDVSRTPVRDALRQLAKEHYVITRPNQGVFVNEWSVDDIKDIFELRVILEAMVVERATANITDDIIDQLRVIHASIQNMLDTKKQPDIEHFLSENHKFHQLLMKTANSRTLSETLSQTVQPPLIARTALKYERGGLQQSNDHHKEIIEALDARDAGWAASVMKAHIMAAQRKFMKNYSAD